MARPYRTHEDERDVFRALAHPVRRRMLMALMGQVQSLDQLCELTGRGKTAVAGHLRILREARLIIVTRKGRSVSYRARRSPLRPSAKWLSALASPAEG